MHPAKHYGGVCASLLIPFRKSQKKCFKAFALKHFRYHYNKNVLHL